VLTAGCASDQSVRQLAEKTNHDLLSKPQQLCGNPQVQVYMNRMAQEVLAAAKKYRVIDAQKDGWVYDKFSAVVVLDPTPNAFVTGADVVYIHSGLIAELETPEQLLAVVTHELSHNELRHLKNNINSQQTQVGLGILAIGASMVDSNAGQAVAMAAGGASVANGMLTTSFNRGQEMEADKYGLELYTKMGYDPRQFARVFEIQKEKHGDGNGMGTHPKNSERIEQVKALSSKSPVGGYHSADLGEFRQVQALVRAEQAQMKKAEGFVGNAAYRNSLMSCFDYCLTQAKKEKTK
jgi:predicted Zn-dependent protease